MHPVTACQKATLEVLDMLRPENHSEKVVVDPSEHELSQHDLRYAAEILLLCARSLDIT